jgi:hypothetical protein
MTGSSEVNPRVAAIVIVVAAAVLLFGGWWTFLRQPPQKLPPGVTNPSRLTEDFYAGRYRPGVGYVNTPQSAPAAPSQPGAAAR